MSTFFEILSDNMISPKDRSAIYDTNPAATLSDDLNLPFSSQNTALPPSTSNATPRFASFAITVLASDTKDSELGKLLGIIFGLNEFIAITSTFRSFKILGNTIEVGPSAQSMTTLKLLFAIDSRSITFFIPSI